MHITVPDSRPSGVQLVELAPDHARRSARGGQRLRVVDDDVVHLERVGDADQAPRLTLTGIGWSSWNRSQV